MNLSTYESATRLENVQDMVWDAGRRSKHARRTGAPSASELSTNGHSEEWTLDIRAKKD